MKSRLFKIRYLFYLVLFLPIFTSCTNQPSPNSELVYFYNFDRQVDNVSANHIESLINKATRNSAKLIVIQLDTPGGLLDSTRKIVGLMLNSEIPIVVYVAPDGARAASAGAFISYSSSYLAMSPSSNIGAASVVDGSGQALSDVAQRKANEDAASLLRSIAVQRNRNVEAVDEIVFNSKSYSSKEAVELNIADTIAENFDILIANLNGKEVLVGNTVKQIEIDQNYELIEDNFNFFQEVVGFLSSPNVAYLLISLGGLALIIELWNFGTIYIGAMGIILLALGFTGIGFTPFDWTGLILILLGIALIITEFFVDGSGYFGAVGAISFIAGSVLLYDSFNFFDEPIGIEGYSASINIWILSVIATLLVVTVTWFIYEVRKSRKKENAYLPTFSIKAMEGSIAKTVSELAPTGTIRYEGEIFSAKISEDQPIKVVFPNQKVIITKITDGNIYVREYIETKE